MLAGLLDPGETAVAARDHRRAAEHISPFGAAWRHLVGLRRVSARLDALGTLIAERPPSAMAGVSVGSKSGGRFWPRADRRTCDDAVHRAGRTVIAATRGAVLVATGGTITVVVAARLVAERACRSRVATLRSIALRALPNGCHPGDGPPAGAARRACHPRGEARDPRRHSVGLAITGNRGRRRSGRAAACRRAAGGVPALRAIIGAGRSGRSENGRSAAAAGACRSASRIASISRFAARRSA